MMTNWNGTILGPPHVSCLRSHALDMCEFCVRRPELIYLPCAECPRESHLQCEYPLRGHLPRLPSNNTIRLESQSTVR